MHRIAESFNPKVAALKELIFEVVKVNRAHGIRREALVSHLSDKDLFDGVNPSKVIDTLVKDKKIAEQNGVLYEKGWL